MATVDFVFASHVIEHAPDMIGWLRQIGQVLGDGGQLYLAIPDKRLCFDVNRDLTTMADLVDAHLRGLSAPGFRQIYDFHSRIIEVDAAALWAGTADYRGHLAGRPRPRRVGLRAVPQGPAHRRVRRRPLPGVHARLRSSTSTPGSSSSA